MQDIIRGKFNPGEKLRITELQKAYEVSSSTLREALTLLVSQSLVVVEGQRGFRVSPMSLADLEDLTRMRTVLECLALEESLTNGGDEWEARVVSAYHKLLLAQGRLHTESSFDEWERRNAEFHEALLAACASPWLHKFRRTLYQQLERYRRLIALGAPGRQIHDEHAEIFDATIKRDTDRASRALALHIRATLNYVKENKLLETASP
ncbi:MAG: FCD domain-containing protein [Pigmentiphaga sp.]